MRPIDVGASRRLRVGVCVAVVALGMLAADQPFSPRKMATVAAADSEWLLASSASDNVVRFEHGLARLPQELVIYFSPNLKEPVAYPLLWGRNAADSGNPLTIKVDRVAVELHIHFGAPLHATWDARTGAWTRHKQGYFQIRAR